jgi:RND family efflux transporter MFP subunit
MMKEITEKADLSALRIDRDKREVNAKPIIKYAVIALLVVFVLVVGYLWLSGTFAGAKEVTVTTASLTYPSAANAVLTASGYVVAQQKASIASKATGRLVYLGVEEGDRVRKNEVIARIEDQDVLASLAQAKANYELAQADLNDARQWLERQRTMLASGTTSQAELDAAEARYKRVEATIKAAEAGVRAAEVALENTRIRAPFDGTVLTKNANVGEVVAPFAAAAGSRAAVVTIADMSSLEVEADVSESNITRVAVGAPCEITLDAYPDRRYQGYVHKIVPTADRAKATVLTKVRFKERDDRVLPEMSAKVTFLAKAADTMDTQAAPRLTVPSSAVVKRDGRDIVLLVRDGQVVETPVRVGGNIGDRIVIEEGLAQGDTVVLRPDPSITTGTKVKVRQ